jgi:hypothetical protein
VVGVVDVSVLFVGLDAEFSGEVTKLVVGVGVVFVYGDPVVHPYWGCRGDLFRLGPRLQKVEGGVVAVFLDQCCPALLFLFWGEDGRFFCVID